MHMDRGYMGTLCSILACEPKTTLKIIYYFLMGRDLNRHFSKEDIEMSKNMKKILNITDHQGNASQNLTPARMATMKKKTKHTIPSVHEGTEKLEPLCTGGRNTKWCSRYGKQ